jgi:hypothetical protein
VNHAKGEAVMNLITIAHFGLMALQ